MASPMMDRSASLEDSIFRAGSDRTRQESPKRKVSEGANVETDSGKKKRRKVNHACVYCRRSHMTCDLERPCARCVKRDIGHLCHDEPRDPPKRSKSEIGVAEIAPAPEEPKADFTGDGMSAMNGELQYTNNGDYDPQVNGNTAAGAQQIAQPTPISPLHLQRPQPTPLNSNNMVPQQAPQNLDWNNSGVHNQFQDMHHLHPHYMFNTSEVTNEYNLLNDFLSTSLLEDGALFADDTQTLFDDPLLVTSSFNALTNSMTQQQPQQAPPALPPPPPTLQPPFQANKAGEEISRPSSAFPVSDKARDKFYMTAADPAGLSSAEDRLHKLLKAKYDAGMLKPFNYVKGYARLNAYMSRHLSREGQLRILKQLDRFRPKFREAMHSLTDMQLVVVEMWFERSLMEYDRVFASMAIPACCWRRTGEIFRGNREMAELIKVPMERLRDGKLAIHEIIAEESLVSYWEKFGAIAFDQSQKAILTSCSLKSPAPEPKTGGEASGKIAGDTNDFSAAKEEPLRCCFSFTIRRDTHNIPSLIVGNFLPIRPRGQQ